MTDFFKQLNNGYVFTYVVLIFLIQVGYSWYRQGKALEIAAQRQRLGLPEDILINQSKKLSELKKESVTQAFVLVVPIVLLPFILFKASGWFGGEDSANGLFYAFIVFLGWLAFSGTDLAKAAIGGIALRTIISLANTIQIGDYVTINGHSGKLVDIGIFYLTLVTVDDDKVCLPTVSLWRSPLVSANDGDRSSLCVISFYLSSTVTSEQLQSAEDAIWDAAQASVYFEPTKPQQIYYTQHPHYIELITKSYVASTYNEPLFRSEITHSFLEFAIENAIPLA
jgi:small-conductance mechanosensitive channel